MTYMLIGNLVLPTDDFALPETIHCARMLSVLL